MASHHRPENLNWYTQNSVGARHPSAFGVLRRCLNLQRRKTRFVIRRNRTAHRRVLREIPVAASTFMVPFNGVVLQRCSNE